MRRIGIVTPEVKRDWAGRELLKAADRLAEGGPVDPMTFEICADGASSIRVQGEPAESFDAFIVRGLNRKGDIDYQYEVLQLLDSQGWLVVNTPDALSVAESKAQTTFYLERAGLPVPRTLVTQSLDEAAAAVREYGTAVLKPLYGSHGMGIEKVEADASDELLPAFLEKYGAVYVQEFIPNGGRDIRALVVGDEIPAAMYRIAREGQWKTNVSQGGSCGACELSPWLREMCLEAAGVIGLDYTGVDVIDGQDGPVILEVNGAPSWYGLFEATGRNVAVDIVSHVLRMIEVGRFVRQPAGFRSRQRMPPGHPACFWTGSRCA